MVSTLANILSVVSPNLPPQLISAEHFAHIELVARHLPGALTTFFGFECRLGDDAPQADFLIYITPAEGGRDMLAGTASAALLLEPLQANPIWQRLRYFCQTWADPASLLAERVRDLWLEFDVTGQSLGLPLPSCFFRPQLTTDDTGEWITATAIHLLRGNRLPTQVEQKILACLAELPAEAYVFQVGVMLARQTEAVRLCIRNIAPDHILPYLVRLGWSGPVQPLAGLVSNLSRRVDRIDLDIDVGQTLLPKVGLECYFNNQRQPKTEPRWPLFLDFLVNSELCRPAKREALLRYPGYLRQKNQAAWSDHLEVAAGLLNGHCESIIFRGLHHIKIVYEPDYALEAKAYLYVSRSLLSQELIKQLSTALA